MSAERLLKTITGGGPAFGIALRSPDPAIVEICAIAGYDWVSFTVEHSSLTTREVANLQRAADVRGISTLVHIASADDPRILPLLDEGVGGFVAAHVTKAQQVEELVRASKFPPIGERGGAGVTRRSDYGAQDYAAYIKRSDELVAVGISIEDVAGVEDADAILGVRGLNLVYVGLHDLTLSMGRPGEYAHPDIRDAIVHIAACAKKHDVALALSEKGFTIRELRDFGAAMIVTNPAGEYIALLDTLTARVTAARAEAA